MNMPLEELIEQKGTDRRYKYVPSSPHYLVIAKEITRYQNDRP